MTPIALTTYLRPKPPDGTAAAAPVTPVDPATQTFVRDLYLEWDRSTQAKNIDGSGGVPSVANDPVGFVGRFSLDIGTIDATASANDSHRPTWQMNGWKFLIAQTWTLSGPMSLAPDENWAIMGSGVFDGATQLTLMSNSTGDALIAVGASGNLAFFDNSTTSANTDPGFIAAGPFMFIAEYGFDRGAGALTVRATGGKNSGPISGIADVIALDTVGSAQGSSLGATNRIRVLENLKTDNLAANRDGISAYALANWGVGLS